MLAVSKPSNPPSTKLSSEFVQWPKLDSQGNSLEDLSGARNSPSEKTRAVDWRDRLAKEKNAGGGGGAASAQIISDNEEDDLDGEDDEMNAAIEKKMSSNRLLANHGSDKEDPANPSMIKFKSSLFNRNVVVVNNTLKRMMKSDKELEDEDDEEDGLIIYLLNKKFYLTLK